MSLNSDLRKLEKHFLDKQLQVEKKIQKEPDIETRKRFEFEKDQLILDKKHQIKLKLEKEKEILNEMGCRTLDKKSLLTKVSINKLMQAFQKTRYLSKEVMKKIKQALNKTRAIALRDLRFLLLPSGLIKALMKDLMKSKLSLLEIKLLTRFLKQLMINLFRRPYLSLNIASIRHLWLKIPLSIRRLIMAIILLKQEMIHKFSLDLEKMKMKLLKEKEITKTSNNVVNLTDEQRRFIFLPDVWIKLNRGNSANVEDEKKMKRKIKKKNEKKDKEN